MGSDLHAIEHLYQKKFDITPESKIALAGSCFAQHLQQHLKHNGYTVLDCEPAPPGLPFARSQQYGYNLYSARFGNIYTMRHLRQLAEEALSGTDTPPPPVWEKEGRFYDSLRPSIEPSGLSRVEEVIAHRKKHLAAVKKMLMEMDVFIFTFGLTEAWVDKATHIVFPTAPGVIAGTYQPEKHTFINFGYNEIKQDFERFRQLVLDARGSHTAPPKFILTVSPVPLAATASGAHILPATVYSKSVLRAVAGDLAQEDHIDYFPSYEIVTSPWHEKKAYGQNGRDVRPEIVSTVMDYFFNAHGRHAAEAPHSLQEIDPFCDEAMLEAVRA